MHILFSFLFLMNLIFAWGNPVNDDDSALVPEEKLSSYESESSSSSSDYFEFNGFDDRERRKEIYNQIMFNLGRNNFLDNRKYSSDSDLLATCFFEDSKLKILCSLKKSFSEDALDLENEKMDGVHENILNFTISRFFYNNDTNKYDYYSGPISQISSESFSDSLEEDSDANENKS